MIKYVVIAIITIAVSGCSKNEGGRKDIHAFFEDIRKVRNHNEIKKYYSTKTIDLLESAETKGIFSNQEKAFLMPLVNSNAKWEKKITQYNNDKAEITITFLNHPVENMIGFQMKLHLKKEKGAWKIDLEESIEKAINQRKKNNAKDYLKQLR